MWRYHSTGSPCGPIGSSSGERAHFPERDLYDDRDRCRLLSRPTVCATEGTMARVKRSVSMPADLARAIDSAAERAGTTFSGWLADTAAHRLRLEAGRRGIAEWERENGPLTPQEIADGLARARALLGRRPRSIRRSA
jgi:hypothetical protein